MTSKAYRVSSPEGAAWAGVEEDETIEVELEDDRETALIAAGWLTPEKTTKSKTKGGDS